ncbi:MAG: hypothetical protein E6J72_03345 [Deltaproteobacteria bacterium]|nr:MAG: hypothetical protein E6J72_03345 [Deltaproteobacteria bacterium]
MRRIHLTAGFLIAILMTGRAPVALAQRERAVGPTPPRLAFVDGQVSFWRPGAEDWVTAQINTPLAAGDELYAGDGGNVDIQIGGRAYLRAGSGTRIGIDSLDTGYLQLEVTSGHCAVDLKRMPEGQVVEVDTPQGAFTIERAGYYRVDVGDNTTFITRRGGAVTVVPAGGETTDLGPDQQIVLEGTDNVRVATYAAPDVDDWDRWNFDRTAHLAERPRSAEYVPPAVAGGDDLDAYGEWRATQRYGQVWVPRDVPSDWAPYSTGRWVYDPSYDWTWVDDAPWGWAPYHYGRWCWNDGYWGWAPGPVVVAPVYAPALVAFFGGGGVSVGIGVGVPAVSWVALGWGEPVVPWWGPAGFVGHAYWGGWGGPRVVNNTVINNTTIVNVTNINRFSNTEVRNAVIGVNREQFAQFGRGHVQPVRLAPEQARQLQPLRGNLSSAGIRPAPASLVPRTERAAVRPPEQIRNRRVVATRPPQDPSPRLRAAGIETRAPAHPAPRVVQSARGHGAAERHGAERTTAPPPPGVEHGGPAQRGAPAERGGAPGAPGERGHGRAVERGAPNERGPGVEGGRGAAPPPPGAGAPAERGGERGRRGAPPPPPGAAPGAEHGGRNVERGGRGVPPPPPGVERGAPAERGGAPSERGGHGRAIERGAPTERGPGAGRGHEAVPPPPGAGAPLERGGERGRHGEPPPPPGAGGRHGEPPPPPGAAAPGAERGGPSVERGHRGAPPPPAAGGERGAPNVERGRPRVERGAAPPPPPPPVPAPAKNERGGGGGRDVERGPHGQPPPQHAPMMMNERGGGNVERGRRSAEYQPPRQPPPAAAPPAMREPAPRGHGGGSDRGAPPPQRERPIAREQARPEPAPMPNQVHGGGPPPSHGGGAPPPPHGGAPPQGGGKQKHGAPDDRHGQPQP